MPKLLELGHYVSSFAGSALARFSGLNPWDLTAASASTVQELLAELRTDDFTTSGDIAIHRTATVEVGATLKGPLIIGARCFIASGAYLRGGNWLAEDCSIGPGAELKSSFLFPGTKLAHFNFVGDSILGANVNLEAGSIVCNYRNERPEHEILIRIGSALHRVGAAKFGALVGDGARIGANAVLAPGTLLSPAAIVRRGAVCDQESVRDELPAATSSP